MPRIAVLLAATAVAGCSGGDEAASANGGPVTIVMDIDSTTVRGPFRVTRGSHELGCSGGTFVTHHLGQDEWSMLQNVLTCTEGERSGSFVMRLEGALSRNRWNFQSGTGDFAGVKGKGKFSWRGKPDDLKGVQTLTGKVRF